MNFISRSNDEWAISKIRDLHNALAQLSHAQLYMTKV